METRVMIKLKNKYRVYTLKPHLPAPGSIVNSDDPVTYNAVTFIKTTNTYEEAVAAGNEFLNTSKRVSMFVIYSPTQVFGMEPQVAEEIKFK
jgi:hypothetical protein